MNKNPKLNKPHQPILNYLNAIERSMIPGMPVKWDKVGKQMKALIAMNRDLLEIIVKHRTHQDLLHDFTVTLVKYNTAVQGRKHAGRIKTPEEFHND